MSWTVLIILFIASIFYLGIAYRESRNLNNSENFFLSSRLYQTGDIGHSLITSNVSIAAVLAAFFSWGHKLGFALWWSPATFALGLITFRIVIINSISPKRDLLQFDTLHEMLGASFESPKIRRLASICSLVGLLGTFGVEVIVGGKILALSFSPNSFFTTIVCTLAIMSLIIAYTCIGGFGSVMKTDRWQNIVTLFAICLILFIIVKGNLNINYDFSSLIINDISENIRHPFSIGYMTVAGYFFINIFWQFIDFSVWQRVLSAKSIKKAMTGVTLAAGGIFIVWLSILAAVVLFRPLADNGTLNEYISYVKVNHGIFANSLLSFGLLAVIVSTADSLLIAAAHTFQLDLLQKRNDNLNRIRKRIVFLGIMATLVTFLVELFYSEIAGILWIFWSLQLSFLAPVLHAIFISHNIHSAFRKPAYTSIMLGMVITLAVSVAGIIGLVDLEVIILLPFLVISGSVTCYLLWGTWARAFS